MSGREMNFVRKFDGVVLAMLLALFGLMTTDFAGAQTTLSTTALNFGNLTTGTTSPLKGTLLKNTQSVKLNISSLVLAGTGYAFDTSTTCPNPGVLAAGASCKIELTFTPAAVGTVPGSVTINDDASNTGQTVTLSGAGVTATKLSTTTLNFGSVVSGATSAIKTVVLTNEQSWSALSITSLAVSGSGYALDSSTTCPNPGTLTALTSCKIALTLTPAAVGSLPGTLTIDTGAGNSTVTLNGTGIAPVALSPSHLGFNNVSINSTSAPRVMTLTNNMSGSITLGPVLFGGPFALDTGAETTCPLSGGAVSGNLAAGASCAIGTVFKPTALGAAVGGQITVADTAPGSPQIGTLTGTGVLPVVFSPLTVLFGNQTIGTTSATKSVTLTNNQAVNLNLTSITPPASYAVVPAGTTCIVGTPVLPGGSCVIGLAFTPTAVGAANGSLSSTNTRSISAAAAARWTSG